MFGMTQHIRGLIYRTGCPCERCKAVHKPYSQRPVAERSQPPRLFVSDRVDMVAEVLHGAFAR